MSQKRLHLYLFPILFLSITTWMVVRGALLGINIHTIPGFVTLEVLLGGSFAIVEAFFLVFLSSQLVVTLKSEDRALQLLRIPLILCILILLLLLPLVGSLPYYAFIQGAEMNQFPPIVLYIWILGALTPIPLALIGMGLAYMISELTEKQEHKSIYELIDQHQGDARKIAEEMNVPLHEAESRILQAVDIGRNGNK